MEQQVKRLIVCPFIAPFIAPNWRGELREPVSMRRKLKGAERLARATRVGQFRRFIFIFMLSGVAELRPPVLLRGWTQPSRRRRAADRWGHTSYAPCATGPFWHTCCDTLSHQGVAAKNRARRIKCR
jgi:hypothetical protein